MLSGIRKRFTYANVAVTLALVFAMSGGAYAASRYVITSTKQISPKVLKTLKGKAGPAGASGAQGPAGAAGPAGALGPTGPKGETGKEGSPGKNGENGKDGTTGFTATLPSGKTEEGDWSLTQGASSETLVSTGVSFGIPLAEAPAPRLIRADGKEVIFNKEKAEVEEVTPSTSCLGSAAEPKANPGDLCVYLYHEDGLVREQGTPVPAICALGSGSGSGRCAFEPSLQNWGADRSGFGLVAFVEAGLVEVEGTWAVTAE
jgi:Collagen triple helix repeat (20 copies)